jgi:(methylthio)acryloyl-CoA hydratase
MSETFTTELRGSTLLVTLTREHKRNALDDETVSGVARALSGAGPEVRCAVLAAAGEHFSAGLDLTELQEADQFGGVQASRRWHKYMDAIQYSPVPVVTALHGAVIGGGLEVAAATHIRVADETTYYALPEGARGIFVGGGGSARLPRLIGVARMADMMLTGRVLTAEEGHAAGLSQYLVPGGTALDKALELADRIAENTRLTNFALTQVLPRIGDASQDVGLLTESLMAALAQSDPEAKERLSHFLAGAAPRVRPDPVTSGEAR